jgi:hypothetical protein
MIHDSLSIVRVAGGNFNFVPPKNGMPIVSRHGHQTEFERERQFISIVQNHTICIGGYVVGAAPKLHDIAQAPNINFGPVTFTAT